MTGGTGGSTQAYDDQAEHHDERIVAPQKRGLIPDAERARVLVAMTTAKDVDIELRAAVVTGVRAGGSIREMAALTGMSTATIQKWGRDGGWPSDEQQAERASRREAVDEYQVKLDAAHAALKYLGRDAGNS